MDRNKNQHPFEREPFQFLVLNTVSLEQYVEDHGEIPDLSSREVEDLIDDKLTCDQVLLLLNNRQQEILLLKMVGYKTHREIGAIMGLADSTIEKENRKIKGRIQGFLQRRV